MSKEKEFYDFYMTVRKRNHLRRELKEVYGGKTTLKIYQEREGQDKLIISEEEEDKLIISEEEEDKEEVYERALYQLRAYNDKKKGRKK